MSPFQSRVLSEREELNEKILKLSTFLGTKVYSSLPPDERGRMLRQLISMVEYSNILSERIDAFYSCPGVPPAHCVPPTHGAA